MYRLGCCIPGGSFMPEGVGECDASAYGILKSGYRAVKNAGFDYAEATVGLAMKLDESAAVRLAEEGVRFEVFNSFIPPSLKITDTPPEKLLEFAEAAMSRITLLGADTVVFGSGAARRISGVGGGADKIESFLGICGEVGGRHGITVAIEPLNSRETDYINTVAEGYSLALKLNSARVKLLADAFHMGREGEPPDIVVKCASMLVHVHVSEADRSYPGASDGKYLRAFAEALAAARYSGRVTAECSFGDFSKECAAAHEFMARIF